MKQNAAERMKSLSVSAFFPPGCLDSQAILKSPRESSHQHRFAFKGESFLGGLHTPPPTMPPFHSTRDVSCTGHLVLALLRDYLLNSPSSKPSGN